MRYTRVDSTVHLCLRQCRNITIVTNARGNTTTYVYDHLGRLATTISAEGVANTQEYDEFGRVVTTTDGLGNATITGYDVLGRRASVADAEGNTTRYEYDALGHQVAVTDASGVRTGYLYDDLGRMIAVTENQQTSQPSDHQTNILTQYLYDALGNRVVITNARGYTSTHTTYDGLNRAIAVRNALGHETQTRYNALGYRTVVTAADGGVTHYGYDGLNRLVSVQHPDATVQYAYNARRPQRSHGNRTAMTDTLGVTTYSYDDLSRVVSVTSPVSGTVSYAYDLAGNRTQLVYPDGKVVTYTYDADNRLTQVEDWDEGLTTYGYDEAGRLATTTLPNGVTTAHEYDAAGRLVHLAHTAAGSTLLSSYSYELDGVGNRVRIEEMLVEPAGTTTRVITNTYDPLNRLIEAIYSTGEQFGYAYDRVGNRTAMTTTLAQTTVTTYTYDAANRLLGSVSTGHPISYTWDTRGNLVGDGTFTYTYNAAGRMVQAESITVTLVYTYNADGLRVAESLDGDVTAFTWDWATDVPEMLSEGDHLYLVGHETLGQWNDGTWRYYLPDALGSVRQTTDSAGALLSVREWSPYGVELGIPQAGLGYTGEWWDADVGLQYLRARWYAPGDGIFLSRDPIEDEPPYQYVRGNPVNWVDPSGLYGKSVHYELTEKLAFCVAHGGIYRCSEQGPCWPKYDLGFRYARDIAEADQYVDNLRGDMHPMPWGQPRKMHFATRREAEQAINWAIENAAAREFDEYDEQAQQVLREFGYALHTLQDSYSHWGEGYMYGKDYEDEDLPPVVMGQVGHGRHTIAARARWTSVHPVFRLHIGKWREELKEMYPETSYLIDDLSADDIMDLWIRAEGVTETGKKYRDRYGYDPDKYFEFSERDQKMKEATRKALKRFFEAFGCPGPCICD